MIFWGAAVLIILRCALAAFGLALLAAPAAVRAQDLPSLTPAQREELWRVMTPEQKRRLWHALSQEQRLAIYGGLSFEQRVEMRRQMAERRRVQAEECACPQPLQAAGGTGTPPVPADPNDPPRPLTGEERARLREQILESSRELARDREQRIRTLRAGGEAAAAAPR